MRRADDWTLRCVHESQMWPDNSFVTLTYGDGKLPENESLDHRDFQLFLKKLRKKYRHKTIRYYMAGEYGDQKGRPHYHACIFNHGFRENRTPQGKSKTGHLYYTQPDLTALWPHGFATVQDFCAETASYCARYIMQLVMGREQKQAYTRYNADGTTYMLKPPYNEMSTKPGLGESWFQKYHQTDVYNHDKVIHNGTTRRPPKYYDKLLERIDADQKELLQWEREQRAAKSADDNTRERRLTREIVHEAKVSTLRRNIE